METRVLGLDLDGVCADFCAAFAAVGTPIAGRALSVVDPSAWELEARYGVTTDLVTAIFDEGTRTGDLYTAAPPIPGRVEAVRRLHADGWEIHVVTARGCHGHLDSVVAATEWWLAEHSVPHQHLTVTSDKHLVPGLALLADDTPANVDRQIAHHGPGTAVLVDADWNRDRTDLPRVMCLSGLEARTAAA